MRSWKTIFQANGMKKQAGVAILISSKTGVATLISDKINLQPKVIKKDKEGHFILIKGKNPPRGTINSEYLCSKYKGIHIH